MIGGLRLCASTYLIFSMRSIVGPAIEICNFDDCAHLEVLLVGEIYFESIH